MSGESNGANHDQPVLVGVDGSPPSGVALKWAAAAAHRSQVPLRVLQVRDHPAPQRLLASDPVWPLPVVTRPNAEAIAEAGKFLTRFVNTTLSTVPSDQLPAHQIVIRDGDAVESLITEAREAKAGLLVLGRRGLGGFASLLLGSVSDKCAAHAPCPVMVVAKDPDEHIWTILVGVDGSPGSLEALRWAANEADLCGARLRIVGTWEAPILPADTVPGPLTLLNEGLELYSADARAAVAAGLRDVYASHPAVQAHGDVIRGDASEILTEMAASDQALMLVVGTRGRGGFKSLLFGSVAHQCLHHARNPVVVVRSLPTT